MPYHAAPVEGYSMNVEIHTGVVGLWSRYIRRRFTDSTPRLKLASRSSVNARLGVMKKIRKRYDMGRCRPKGCFHAGDARRGVDLPTNADGHVITFGRYVD